MKCLLHDALLIVIAACPFAGANEGTTPPPSGKSAVRHVSFACHPHCGPNYLNYSENPDTEDDSYVYKWVYHEPLKGFLIAFLPWINGGGTYLESEYVPYIWNNLVHRTGPFERCFEWCSGPGFIGFQFLALGLCKTLALADVNPVAVKAMKRTVEMNGLEAVVDVYLSNNLDDIPNSEHGRWDLVVANPPHCSTKHRPEQDRIAHILIDIDWKLHRGFYTNIMPFMHRLRGQIIISEAAVCSPERRHEFAPMLPEGLAIVGDEYHPDQNSYYFWTTDATEWSSANPLHPDYMNRQTFCQLAWSRNQKGYRDLLPQLESPPGCKPKWLPL